MTNQLTTPKMAPVKVLTVPPPQKKITRDPKITAKAYRQKNKDKIAAYRKANRENINRNKLLWNLNHGYQKRSNVLDKYNIEYSDELKRYIHKAK